MRIITNMILSFHPIITLSGLALLTNSQAILSAYICSAKSTESCYNKTNMNVHCPITLHFHNAMNTIKTHVALDHRHSILPVDCSVFHSCWVNFACKWKILHHYDLTIHTFMFSLQPYIECSIRATQFTRDYLFVLNL